MSNEERLGLHVTAARSKIGAKETEKATPMAQTTKPGARPRISTIVALLAGLTVFLLLFPASGTASLPPECYSMLGYVVPCEAWVAWAAGTATAGLVGVGLWMTDRHQR